MGIVEACFGRGGYGRLEDSCGDGYSREFYSAPQAKVFSFKIWDGKVVLNPNRISFYMLKAFLIEDWKRPISRRDIKGMDLCDILDGKCKDFKFEDVYDGPRRRVCDPTPECRSNRRKLAHFLSGEFGEVLRGADLELLGMAQRKGAPLVAYMYISYVATKSQSVLLSSSEVDDGESFVFDCHLKAVDFTVALDTYNEYVMSWGVHFDGFGSRYYADRAEGDYSKLDKMTDMRQNMYESRKLFDVAICCSGK